MENESDVLVEIADKDLPELKKFYEENLPWAHYIPALIDTLIRWKRLEKIKDKVQIFSPFGSWKSDGTIIVLQQFDSSHREIYLFTLDEQGRNLYRGFVETKLLRYDIHTVFYAVHKNHLSVLYEYLKDKNITVTDNVPCYFYYIEPNEAKKFTIDTPNEVYIKRIDQTAAEEINSVWPHRFEGSVNYLSTFLECNGGYGIFDKSTNAMIGWTIRHIFGNFTALQITEGYEGKGYGSLLIKVIAKEIAEQGYFPCGTVLVQNTRSKKLFEKLGFQTDWNCEYVFI